MIYLILVILLYIYIEGFIKIKEDDKKSLKLFKSITIFLLTLVIIHLIYGVTIPGIVYILLIIYIVSNVRQDGINSFINNLESNEKFTNYELDSNYHKCFDGEKNTFCRNNSDFLYKNLKEDRSVYNDLNHLYPKPVSTSGKNIKENVSNISVDFDNELEPVKKALMNKFWLMDNKHIEYKTNTNTKKDKKCNIEPKTTNKKIKKVEKEIKKNFCHYYNKFLGIFNL